MLKWSVSPFGGGVITFSTFIIKDLNLDLNFLKSFQEGEFNFCLFPLFVVS